MNKKGILLIITLLICGSFLVGCKKDSKTVIELADINWDSINFHNAVATFVAENAYGYETREVSATTPLTVQALKENDLDVVMEMWTDNVASYQDDIDSGAYKELGTNFDDNNQGFYVPRYVIEGDPERNIKPMAPDLKTVSDLVNYKDIFVNEENTSKGRIYGAISGWEIDDIMYKKYKHYGLDKDFDYFRPGSDSALTAAFQSAYEKGEPIVGYYWEPTWITGKYDLVLLDDSPYDPVTFEDGKTACPSVNVTICASNDMMKKAPDFVEFLTKYQTSSALTAEALAYMQVENADYEDTAKWFLKNHDELISEWLPKDKAELVRNALNQEDENMNSQKQFPDVFKISINDSIDNVINKINKKCEGFFNVIKDVVLGFLNGIGTIINIIPWWLLILIVFFLGWKSSKKIHKGILYAFSLFLIGVLGLWELMNLTLSIVIASVLISLLLGLPIGILLSSSKRAFAIVRPLLDAMQTMPSFVYLIPAVMFFGLGKVPAVMATIIYAIPPVIRLTCHAINQVDKEMIEAAQSFGSTRMQLLLKVKLPQAVQTIMTGVNQTMMMAVSMVVTCSMIGAAGLGEEVLIGINRLEIGRGFTAGLSIVIIAILMDRLTQGWFSKKASVMEE